jgi:transaldolase
VKIFIDSANLAEIETFLSWGICDGVTTNPSISVACGVRTFPEMRQRCIDIARLIEPRPLSVEVTSDQREEMLEEAHEYASWANNINVKITITTRAGESCLPVVHQLYQQGIDVNVTAMMTVNQAVLAAKAGGRYLSLFGGRIDDEGGDAESVILRVKEWLDRWGHTCPNNPEIIVGSSRTTKNVADWACTGAHILTVTPQVLSKILVNARTKETVTQFLDDAQKALISIRK